MSTHFLNLVCGWDLDLGDGAGSNPANKRIKKMSTHFLSLVCGWIWTWGMGRGQIQPTRGLRK